MSEEQFEATKNRLKQALGTAQDIQKDIAKVTKSKGQLRRRKGPNKTEAAFGEYLKLSAGLPIGFEAVTLRMPGGTRYTPDWPSWEQSDNMLYFYEVKGFMREAARVRLKEFAAHFTMFRFFLVRAKNRSMTEWQIDEI